MPLKIYSFLQSLCLLIPVVLSAQTPNGFGTDGIPAGYCISAEERNMIRQHLQAQLQTLGFSRQSPTNGLDSAEGSPLRLVLQNRT